MQISDNDDMALKVWYLSKECLGDMQPCASGWKIPNCCSVTVRNLRGLLNALQQKNPAAALFFHHYYIEIRRVHPFEKHVAVAALADGEQ